MSRVDGKWVPENCQKIVIPMPDGLNTFICRCTGDLYPSTIIDDIEGFFVKSKAELIFHS